jgi:hypothetical protein
MRYDDPGMALVRKVEAITAGVLNVGLRNITRTVRTIAAE